MKKRKKIIITDWHVLPLWGKGLAIGAITGAILMIPASLLLYIHQNFIFAPLAVFIISCVAGLFLTKNKKISRRLR